MQGTLALVFRRGEQIGALESVSDCFDLGVLVSDVLGHPNAFNATILKRHD